MQVYRGFESLFLRHNQNAPQKLVLKGAFLYLFESVYLSLHSIEVFAPSGL